MSLTASARSIPGTLRQEVEIGGRHLLTTDEPEHLGGEDGGPAPHELLPAALAACIATTLAVYARTKHWELGEVGVDVVYDHRATPRHFDVVVRFTGDLTADQLARLGKVAETCPVRRALEAGAAVSERLEHAAPAVLTGAAR